MKKQFFKTGIPLLLLAFVTLFIGSGCYVNPDYYWYLDNDGDGYGDNSVPSIYQEGQPVGYVLDNTDCDDTDDLIHPDATDIPDNDVDEDCNGLYAYTFYVDDDGDGFGGSQVVILEIALGTEDEVDSKFVSNNADCDDTNSLVNILADEIMGNGIDDNCNGLIDAEDIRYFDEDGDGYGSDIQSAADGVFNSLDCDDLNPDIHPYATEVAGDGIDNDCDGYIDE
ncbi:MAG: hypothetical protein COB73_09675 [Flavobacteriaceae bacterium]|nr:MAG: hypothetical protein COB73_09675 [Flavobacteriaceae bacterium]